MWRVRAQIKNVERSEADGGFVGHAFVARIGFRRIGITPEGPDESAACAQVVGRRADQVGGLAPRWPGAANPVAERVTSGAL